MAHVLMAMLPAARCCRKLHNRHGQRGEAQYDDQQSGAQAPAQRTPDSFDALRPVAIIAGMVPRPKLSMTRPPVIALAVVAASSSTL